MMGDTIAQSWELPKGVTFEDVLAAFRENVRYQNETERLIKEMSAEIRELQKETALQMKETDRRLEERRLQTDRWFEEQRLQTDRWFEEQRLQTDRQIKEQNLETDRRLEEQNLKTDRRLEEQNLKTDRRLEKMGLQTDRRLGELGLRLGDIMEHFMSPKLHEKFEALNFNFNHSSRNHEIKDRNKRRLAEIDVLLENGEYAMAVEVKTRLTSKDVKDHVKRMEILRRVADEHDDKRKYLGAVAGAVVTPEVTAYALKNGFYVIVPSGETVDIEAPDGFKPRIW